MKNITVSQEGCNGEVDINSFLMNKDVVLHQILVKHECGLSVSIDLTTEQIKEFAINILKQV